MKRTYRITLKSTGGQTSVSFCDSKQNAIVKILEVLEMMDEPWERLECLEVEPVRLPDFIGKGLEDDPLWLRCLSKSEPDAEESKD